MMLHCFFAEVIYSWVVILLDPWTACTVELHRHAHTCNTSIRVMVSLANVVLRVPAVRLYGRTPRRALSGHVSVVCRAVVVLRVCRDDGQ
jgi:hypothetical protein